MNFCNINNTVANITHSTLHLSAFETEWCI